MCEELKEELEEGNDLAKKLAEHVENMGAGKATWQVISDETGEQYQVEVKLLT